MICRYLNLVLITIISVSANAQNSTGFDILTKSPYVTDINETHRLGIKYIGNGNVLKAWETLIPHAKNGDSNSMYILGKMIMTTPSLHNKLNIAQKLLTQAAKQNHPLAKHTLTELKTVKNIDQLRPSYIKDFKIDEEAKNKFLQAQKAYQVRKPTSKKIQYLFFIDTISPKYNHLMDISTNLEQRFGQSAMVKYILVTKLSNIQENQFGAQVPRFKHPKDGLGIDPDGVKANKYNVSSFPSVVAVYNGEHLTVPVESSSHALNELVNFYRDQVN